MKSYLLERCPIFSRRTLQNNGSSQPCHYPRQPPPPPDFQNSSRCQHVPLRRPASPTSSQVRGRPSLPPLPSLLGYSCRWSFKEEVSLRRGNLVVLECQQRASRLSVVPGGQLRKAKCEQVATEKRGLKQFHKDSLLAQVSYLRRLLEPWQKLFR